MKKYVFVIALLCAVSLVFGCGKKEDSLEQLQEPVSMDALSAMNTTVTETKTPGLELQTTAAQTSLPTAGELKSETLPPPGPYKPTTREIQAALKGAGYYTGSVDGKIGPLTKKAIEAFQKDNGLKVDGKVGPKTWAVLSKYSGAAAGTTAAASKEKSSSLTLR